MHRAFGFVAFVGACAVAAASAFGAQVRQAVDFSLGPTQSFGYMPGDNVSGDELVGLAVINAPATDSAWEPFQRFTVAAEAWVLSNGSLGVRQPMAFIWLARVCRGFVPLWRLGLSLGRLSGVLRVRV